MVCRRNFADLHLNQKTELFKWIFTDEKWLALDGPRNLRSYGTRRTRLRRIERQIACGDVIVLGGIYSNGKLKIKVNETHYKTCQIEAFYITECKQKSQDYIEDLTATPSPLLREEMGRQGWT
uniref:Uncharacterized protein n=1 Tax=Bursaphelenchus xylophilus TaxID=6326 RepID=A0A1I7SG56_BURXY